MASLNAVKHLFGGACLEPGGLIGYDDVPTKATGSMYEVATLPGYEPAVKPSALALPAAPHPSPAPQDHRLYGRATRKR